MTGSNNAVRPVICEVSILLTCGKHLHDRIKSLRGKSWAHKTSLTPRLFIEACEPSQESDLSCICVGVSMLSLSTFKDIEVIFKLSVYFFKIANFLHERLSFNSILLSRIILNLT